MKTLYLLVVFSLLPSILSATFEGFPRPSDIFMRTLSVRVSNETDPLDTRHAVSNFSVSRLEWVYWGDSDKDRSLIRDLTGKLTRFGGSLNPTQPPLAGATPFCRGLDGEPTTVPWLKIPRTGRYLFWGFFMAQKGLVRLSIGDREIFSVAKASGQGRGEVVLEEGLHPVCAEVVESHSDGSKGNHYFFIGFSGPGIPETRLTDIYLVYVPEKP